MQSKGTRMPCPTTRCRLPTPTVIELSYSRATKKEQGQALLLIASALNPRLFLCLRGGCVESRPRASPPETWTVDMSFCAQAHTTETLAYLHCLVTRHFAAARDGICCDNQQIRISREVKNRMPEWPCWFPLHRLHDGEMPVASVESVAGPCVLNIDPVCLRPSSPDSE